MIQKHCFEPGRSGEYADGDVIRGCAAGILTESMEKSWFGLFRLTFL